MKELDFSEEACIERYARFGYFDEVTEYPLHIEGIGNDEPIISALHKYGRIATDWDTYETGKPAAEESMIKLKMAA